MAARIRAIIERIKQEPGWLLVLLGLLTLYVTYKLYQHYVGGQNTGGYVPNNGIDVPFYPSSVGGTPGNPGVPPDTGPGGIGTSYGQQLQDLLNALGGNGVVPSIPTYTSGGTTSSPSTTTTASVSSGGTASSGAPNLIQQIISAALTLPNQVAAQLPNATPPTPPTQTVADNPALWAAPASPTTSQLAGAIVSAANNLTASATVGDNPSQWAQPVTTSAPGAASPQAQTRHQNQDLGY